jgi:transcriptional regulatory protein GAL4
LTIDQIAPIVHEPTIRAQLAGVLPIPGTRGTQALLYMIFAMGALDTTVIDDSTRGDVYFERADSALLDERLDAGSIPTIQALAIMSIYLQRTDRPDRGYMLLGRAIRMALVLGLHDPTRPHPTSPFAREMRLRIWWGLVVLEAGCSVTFGRPHAAGAYLLGACPLPSDCSDDDFSPISTQIPWPRQDQISPYTSLLWQATLTQVTCGIHERALCTAYPPTLQQIERYDQHIAQTLQSFPPKTVEVAHVGMHIFRWRTRDIRAILYRPIFIGAVFAKHDPLQLPQEVLSAVR